MTEKKIYINFNYEEQTYTVRLDFADVEKRNVIKQAGWKWNPDKKYWQTVKREKVIAILEHVENANYLQVVFDLLDHKLACIPGLNFSQQVFTYLQNNK